MSEEDTVPVYRLLATLATVLVCGFVLAAIAAAVLELRERQLRPGRRFPEHDIPRQELVANVHTQMFAEPPSENPEPGYAWVDRDKRLVRIPVEQAMELVARGMRPK